MTGESVPDESARVVKLNATSIRGRATWPAADFVIGNPPFIGAGWMRTALGEGYAEAVRAAWPEVPGVGGFRDVLVASSGNAGATRRNPAVWLHYHQQPAPDLQPAGGGRASGGNPSHQSLPGG